MSNILNISGPIRVGRLSADPSNPSNGLIYYNTTSNEFRQYVNGTFYKIADQSVIDALTASQVAYARLDANKKNIQATSDDLETATTDLDDAIGALQASPSNYTPVDPTIVADHLAGIDTALGSISTDASAITYTPLTLTDWNSSADPGNTDDALDQLASRVKTNEGNIALKANDADVIKKDGSVAFTAAQSMGGFKLTSVAEPTASSDAATKNYVDTNLQGLKPKEAVRAATTAAGTLSTDFANGQTVDGVTLATGDRILIKDQASASENGIYTVNASGAPTRATDFDSVSPIDEINGAFVPVQEGTANAGKLFVQTGTVATIDTDAVNFVFFNSISNLVGGDGITVSGANLSVDQDGEGLQFVTGQLSLELDGSTLSKSATGLKVATSGITNNEVATGIDAAKLADGTVSNTEFQYINSLTSNAQTQIDGKLANVVEDTTPQLGGNLDVNGKSIEDAANEIVVAGQNSVRRAKQASKANFVEEEYIHAISLAGSQTNTVITDFTFAHATIEGLEIVYKVKEATSGDIRIGTLRVVTNGTSVVLNDVSTETADTGITFDAVVNGANINIRYSSGANGATMRADVKKFLA